MTSNRYHTIAGIAVFAIMLGVYLTTMAPSISFWDCGEFITCSYIMGIPHPPGSPLLSLVGRVMSLISFPDFRGQGTGEIAYRVNMLDVLLGALTAMLTYFIVVRLIRRFRPGGGGLQEVIAGFAAALTALMVGFMDEFWTNAIETETYMPSMFMSMLALWLALRWDERRHEPGAVRYLFLAAYIIGLGNGVHLYVLLIAPTIILVALFGRPDWFASRNLWAASFGLLAVAVVVKLFTGLAVQYTVMALVALVAPLVLSRLYRTGLRGWTVTLSGLLLCGSLYVIGFSVYPTVMVRASMNPAINEGDPDNWESYRLYMARDQYGQENMYVGMFTRNASFSYQFGFMYLRYLIQQFPSWGPTVPVTFTNDRSADFENVPVLETVYLPVLLLSLLLYGFFTHAREDRRMFAALMLYFVTTSVGMVLYLNMENPQVRERAYFFLGSFYILTWWIGIGAWGLVTDIAEWLRDIGKARAAVPAGGVVMALLATMIPTAVLSRHIDPGFTNWEVHNRTHDWIPWDYGYNILTSCEPNAILFTNGDNDTFPLWYLQEVLGYRNDVRVINLSLLNTSWYIRQIKNENLNVRHDYHTFGTAAHLENQIQADEVNTLPIQYTDEYIDNVLCGSTNESYELRIVPIEGRVVTVAGITWTIPSAHRIQISSDRVVGMIRIQDVMVTQIINWNNWKRPVYFAVTVAQENKIGLMNHLAMEGMVYRLNNATYATDMQVAVDRMHENIFTRYRYRSLDDPTIYKQPNTLKLVTNYFIGFAQLAERYASAGNEAMAKEAAWGAINRTPNDFGRRLFLYQLFENAGMADTLREFLAWEVKRGEYDNLRESIREDRFTFAALLDAADMKAEADTLVAAEEAALEAGSAGINERLNIGVNLVRGGFDRFAAEYFAALVERYPDNADVWRSYIAALYGAGEVDAALNAAERLAKLAPDDPSTAETLRLLRQRLGRADTTAAGGQAPVQ